MTTSRIALLRWQFDLAWALCTYHLDRLDDGDPLWRPATHGWTVHRGEDGRWRPDWAGTEPDPVPVPTVAWVTWHLGWWWSTTMDHLRGRTPRDRTDVTWPGDADSTVAWMHELRGEWEEILDGLSDDDLDAATTFPWEDDPTKTVGHTLAWATVELTKNVAEIGQLRLLRAAQGARPASDRAEPPASLFEVRVGVLATEARADRLAEDVGRLLCPNPEHPGPCPVPWSVSVGPADAQDYAHLVEQSGSERA